MAQKPIHIPTQEELQHMLKQVVIKEKDPNLDYVFLTSIGRGG